MSVCPSVRPSLSCCIEMPGPSRGCHSFSPERFNDIPMESPSSKCACGRKTRFSTRCSSERVDFASGAATCRTRRNRPKCCLYVTYIHNSSSDLLWRVYERAVIKNRLPKTKNCINHAIIASCGKNCSNCPNVAVEAAMENRNEQWVQDGIPVLHGTWISPFFKFQAKNRAV